MTMPASVSNKGLSINANSLRILWNKRMKSFQSFRLRWNSGQRFILVECDDWFWDYGYNEEVPKCSCTLVSTGLVQVR